MKKKDHFRIIREYVYVKAGPAFERLDARTSYNNESNILIADVAIVATVGTSTPPILVKVAPPLIERIHATDLDDVDTRDLNLPFVGFMLEFPSVGHAPQFVCVAKADTMLLLDCMYVMENGEIDESPLRLDGSLTDLRKTVASKNITFETNAVDVEEIFAFLKSIVGVCLYLSTENPDLTIGKRPLRAHDGKIVLPPIRTKKKRGRQQRKDAQRQRTIVAGGSLPPFKAHANTIVRGHFRRQAHGPGRTLRKTIWIQPHLRFRDDSFPVVGRDIEA